MTLLNWRHLLQSACGVLEQCIALLYHSFAWILNDNLVGPLPGLDQLYVGTDKRWGIDGYLPFCLFYLKKTSSTFCPLGWISMMSDLRRGENRRRGHNGAALSDRDRLFCLSSYNLSLGFEEQSECEMCPNVSLQEQQQQAIVAESDTRIYMHRCLWVDLFANVS